MAGMFDAVSDRYDLLNSVMSLGRDRAWRAALARAVPEEARVVLDLCSGSGASLDGPRRPGRLLLGVDVSLRMLQAAARRHANGGWAPRLVCADAFRLPLPAGSVDAVTIAFGIRNLRPRPAALREIARVLRPGGTLAVLEATASEPGPLAPAHAFYLTWLVPLAGRLSPDPSAYRYLGESILDFGAGPEFERDLESSGFALLGRRRFLLGAARLWIGRRAGSGGGVQIAAVRPPALQDARPVSSPEGTPAVAAAARDTEWRVWTAAQFIVAAALTVALGWGIWSFVNYGSALPLETWQRNLSWVLLVGGLLGFGVRALVLLGRVLGPPSRP
jgi:demethylmenaquinone methyltransferase / 2-methoxy-6-polyprenyl-1,4-benzoquinol methylase